MRARLSHRAHRRHRLRQEHRCQPVRRAGSADHRHRPARRAKSSRRAQRCCARSPSISACRLLNGDGTLNRQELRKRIFEDLEQRKWLEALLHPAIRELTDARSEAASGPYVIVAIPLLVETDGAARFDRVLVVDCDPDVQLARLMARDGATARRCSAHARCPGAASRAPGSRRRRDPQRWRPRIPARPGREAASPSMSPPPNPRPERNRRMTPHEFGRPRNTLRAVYGWRHGRAE